MISSENRVQKYVTLLSNGTYMTQADTTREKGAQGLGFRPHELLEAALASCMNMSLRMHAQKLGLSLSKVEVRVTLNRNEDAYSTFEYDVALDETLLPEERRLLLDALEHSPVRTTLSKPFHFRQKN